MVRTIQKELHSSSIIHLNVGKKNNLRKLTICSNAKFTAEERMPKTLQDVSSLNCSSLTEGARQIRSFNTDDLTGNLNNVFTPIERLPNQAIRPKVMTDSTMKL